MSCMVIGICVRSLNFSDISAWNLVCEAAVCMSKDACVGIVKVFAVVVGDDTGVVLLFAEFGADKLLPRSDPLLPRAVLHTMGWLVVAPGALLTIEVV